MCEFVRARVLWLFFLCVALQFNAMHFNARKAQAKQQQQQ